MNIADHPKDGPPWSSHKTYFENSSRRKIFLYRKIGR